MSENNFISNLEKSVNKVNINEFTKTIKIAENLDVLEYTDINKNETNIDSENLFFKKLRENVNVIEEIQEKHII